MKKITVFLLVGMVMLFAKSEAGFPSNWKSFKSLHTPLTKIGALPGCNANVSSLPLIYRETVSTYCAIKPGGPGAVEVLANDKAINAYKKRDGKFPDGSVLILHLKDLKVLFVTTYKGGKPFYSIYTEDGKDVSGKKGSGLNPIDCRTCHTGYSAFCVNGQCGRVQ